MNSLENSIPDFESGPLDRFRIQASFSWKKMKLFFNDPDIITYKANIWNTIKQDPLFQPSFKRFTHDELRKRTFERVNKFRDYDFLPNEELIGNFDKAMAFLEILMFLDPALGIKFRIGYGMFASTVLALGSKETFHYGLDNQSGKIIGSFALTEIAHGSNVSGMMTTATFIKSSNEFELNTPSFESAKCWVGVLGQTAEYAIVYANLISSDGHNHGLHPFVVPIRDVKTKQAFPRVKVGDLGEKIGLNGLDNGWVMFDNYRIPKENLLSKTGSLDSNGKYISLIKDPKKRMGSNFGVLSTGRIAISGISTVYLIKALTIAIRYSLIRKQFGPPGESEYEIMEYQTHQYRLIPYIAIAYVHYYFSYWLSNESLDNTLKMIIGDQEDANSVSKKMPETHALSSAIKAHAGWSSFEGIQQCREACGGHGYLKAAGIGDIRNDNDANIIYEGENTIIIQQTSRWLISLWKNQGKSLNNFETPYESVKFLGDSNIIRQRFQATSIKETLDLQTISNSFKWLIYWLLSETNKKIDQNLEKGQNSFDAQNNSQIFYAKNLSLAYIQHFVFIKFWEKIVKSELNETMREVLINICALYGAFHLDKHLVSFYQGGYAIDSSMGEFIHEGILNLCKTLKPDVLALIETLAPPDFVLNSVLGQSNGDPYGNMEKVINADSYNLNIPNWVHEKVTSKL